MYTVVIADDEPYILQGLEKKVDWPSLGFEIIARANNGLDCLRLVEEHRPDLLVSDIRMPGMDGIQLIETVRSRFEDTLIIFISGYSEFEYARKALELGALSYLLKPIGKKDLRSALEKARERIDWKRSEYQSRRERAADDILDFLSAMPPGIDRDLVLKKLSLGGAYDWFLCIVEEAGPDPGISQRLTAVDCDILTLNPGGAIIIHILNLQQKAIEGVIDTVASRNADGSRSVGISASTGDIGKLGDLIRQAKHACFSFYSTGKRGIYHAGQNVAHALTEMMNDFEILFSIGNEGKLHHLLDEAAAAAEKSGSSMDEILTFHNGIIELCNRYSMERKTPFYADTLFSDPEQLYRKHPGLQKLIEYLHDIVHELFESTARGALIRDSSADSVAGIKQYIRKNLDADLSSDSISAIFHTEKNQLTTLFRSETGGSLTEFVRAARLDHACFLLQHTSMSINEVADMCGFNDYFYFARLFKREKGFTATEYRRKRTT